MVFLTLRAAWLRRQRAKSNRIRSGIGHVVGTRKLSPKSLVRYAATSKNAYQSTAIERSRIAALKRVLRRRIARMRHFENGVLRTSLHEARTTAVARASMTPAERRARRVSAVRNAFWRVNPNNPAQWRRFVQLHVASGGSPNITVRNAIRMYN